VANISPGQKFGRWTVQGPFACERCDMWTCACRCGTTRPVRAGEPVEDALRLALVTLHAMIGAVQIYRGDGETIEAFQRRAREFATEAGSDHVIFGGLPAMRFEEGEAENGTTD
jgi:hypothetical protein